MPQRIKHGRTVGETRPGEMRDEAGHPSESDVIQQAATRLGRDAIQNGWPIAEVRRVFPTAEI